MDSDSVLRDEYHCPRCGWMGHDPKLSPLHKNRCPECECEVNRDE